MQLSGLGVSTSFDSNGPHPVATGMLRHIASATDAAYQLEKRSNSGEAQLHFVHFPLRYTLSI